ncbi:MAG: ribonuclease P protein component [Verrucomicrobiaceae bacterium]|nr:MAG: ribonuclease P protein component [Verrucomicrobiaceae bacterium]
MRLPRTCSMNQRSDFERVKKTGQAKAGRFVILSTLPDPALATIRTGFITTRRSGKAHDRNLLRRRFRALVQAHASTFADIHRYLVTIARPGASQATFAELEADWLKQARRLGLFPRPEDKP